MAKIYTKKGDKGNTKLFGGKEVSKSDDRLEAYGTTDELNAFIGYLKDHDTIDVSLKQQLHWIQEHLFSLGTVLANPDEKLIDIHIITQKEVKQLEIWIDNYDAKLPPLQNFILPGGGPSVSLVHVCRTVTRRAERAIIRMSKKEKVPPDCICFINRLSDYFFIFGRYLGKSLGAREVIWTSTNS